jgi:hypothetical protein
VLLAAFLARRRRHGPNPDVVEPEPAPEPKHDHLMMYASSADMMASARYESGMLQALDTSARYASTDDK